MFLYDGPARGTGLCPSVAVGGGAGGHSLLLMPMVHLLGLLTYQRIKTTQKKSSRYRMLTVEPSENTCTTKSPSFANEHYVGVVGDA
jgi:hypothetical protein